METTSYARTLRYNGIVLLLMLATVGFSYVLFIHQSLRLDEAQTFWQVTRSPLGVLHTVGKDVHVPLYHILIYLWQMVFGHGVETARAFSVLLFALSVPLLVMLGNLVYRNRSTSIFAAAIFALSPFMNWYGNDIRMYSLLVAVAILNQYFFIKIRRTDAAYAWWGYTITGIIGIYTHYYFGLVLLAQAAFYFLYHTYFPVDAFKKFIIAASVVLLSLVPWITYVWYLGEVGNSRPLLPQPGLIEIFNTFSHFLFGEQSYAVNSFVVALWPLIMLSWFFSLQKKRVRNPDTAYLLFSIVFAVGVAFLVSIVIRPVYLERYLIFTLPAFCLLVAAMIDSYSLSVRRIVQTCLIIAMLATLGIQAYSFDTPTKENYAAATTYLSIHATPQDVIILSAPFTVYPVEYYYQGPVAIRTLPIWDRFVPGPIPAFNAATLPDQVARVAGKHERAWLLLSYDQGYEQELLEYFDQHYERLESQTLSPGLTLLLYRLRYDVISSTAQ